MTIKQILALTGSKRKRVTISESEVPDWQELRTFKNGGAKTIPNQTRAEFMVQVNKNQRAISNVSVQTTCKYCGRSYTYSLLVGDCSHGACNRSSCIRQSMSDNL